MVEADGPKAAAERVLHPGCGSGDVGMAGVACSQLQRQDVRGERGLSEVEELDEEEGLIISLDTLPDDPTLWERGERPQSPQTRLPQGAQCMLSLEGTRGPAIGRHS
jgi:hypothetical protein